MIGEAQREAVGYPWNSGFESAQASLVTRQHQHSAKVDGECQHGISIAVDVVHHRQQLGLARRIRLPVLAKEGIDQLPADQRLLHQRAHRVGDGETVLWSSRARAGEGGIPAHRITGDCDDFDLFAVDDSEIA